ncbi:thiamine pyrophosphate-binding protein [Arthrobacter sp. KNU40]|uniref:thiamine pyrophosphate-binding protein n=1 Tax=Arthrobacter sp. KNU40 TaxID=3447965 RepID=UPI003F5EFAA4
MTITHFSPTTSVASGTVRLTGAQALVRVLENSDIRNFFGIVGGNLTGIFKELDSRPELNYTGCRHEAAGAFMATAVYNSTGQLAVALGELGPGTLNLASGLGVAFNNNLPMIAISSTWPAEKTTPLVGTMMELDGIAATSAVTKWSARVAVASRIPSLVRWAIREALTGRPGPVHLDIPGDVLKAEHDYNAAELDAPIQHFLPAGRTPADPAQVIEAAKLIGEGRRILLLGGGGVVHADATEEFRRLAAKLGAASTVTQMAIGVVRTDSPDFIGHAGALGGVPVVRAFQEADVVIAVGCKFSSWIKDGNDSLVAGWPLQQLIHIDVDPTAIGRAQPVSVGLVGDAKAILSQLLEAVGQDAVSDPEWLASLVADQQERERELGRLADDPRLHPAAVAIEIGAALPEDALVVYDGGHTSFWTNDLTPAFKPRTRFNDPGMAQIGFGTPFALGLKTANPEKAVFNVTGDGSFGFTLQELDTARRYGLAVINVIHNNESWGVIEQGQRNAGFEHGAQLTGTDYAAIARGFGCFGETVTVRSEIGPAIRRALESGLPAVLDVRTWFDPHPNMSYFGGTLR